MAPGIKKLIWPTFNSKVGESVLIAMKIEFDLLHRQLYVCTNFQINISKHVEKSSESLKKFKTRKNNCQNSQNKIFAKNGTYVEKYTEGYLCTKIYLDLSKIYLD